MEKHTEIKQAYLSNRPRVGYIWDGDTIKESLLLKSERFSKTLDYVFKQEEVTIAVTNETIWLRILGILLLCVIALSVFIFTYFLISYLLIYSFRFFKFLLFNWNKRGKD